MTGPSSSWSIRQVDAIFFGFQTAFDRVSHGRLGIKAPALRNSRRHTQLDNGFSFTQVIVCVCWWPPVFLEGCLVRSPQDPVIGPSLFLLFINDIQNNIKSHFQLFADDCVVYREIVTDEDRNILQQDLLQLSSWTTMQQIKSDVQKCAVLSIPRKCSPRNYEYHLDTDALPRALLQAWEWW